MLGSSTDRGVSVAVTHVLAIAITVILIGVLFVGVGDLVETQTDRSAESSLETIGERLSDQFSNAERLADDEAEIRAEHPSHVSGMSYSLELVGDDECEAPLVENRDYNCLVLEANGADVVVTVPVTAEIDDDEDCRTARGGAIDIEYVTDDGICLSEVS